MKVDKEICQENNFHFIFVFILINLFTGERLMAALERSLGTSLWLRLAHKKGIDRQSSKE
jgi:hypothetical protein